MKRAIIFFIFFALILVSGCIGQPPDDNIIEWRENIGTRGVDFDFYDLRDSVQAGESFDITLELENKGEANLEPNTFKVTISGGSYEICNTDK